MTPENVTWILTLAVAGLGLLLPLLALWRLRRLWRKNQALPAAVESASADKRRL